MDELVKLIDEFANAVYAEGEIAGMGCMQDRETLDRSEQARAALLNGIRLAIAFPEYLGL